MRVLVVDDEVQLADTVARGLRRHGCSVDVAYDGDSALEKASFTPYDVVVLDRDLPRVHGDVVCQRLSQERYPGRILMLTAASTNIDVVHGLGLGADDYLGKPFDFAVLVARVQTLGRRSAPTVPVVLRWGDIEVDPSRNAARRAGRDLSLTPRELAVLEVMVRAEGRLVSAEDLLEKAWDEHADPFTTSVRVIMSRVRSKLGKPDAIETVVGRGYRLRS